MIKIPTAWLTLAVACVGVCFCAAAAAQEPSSVDRSTLTGKVMCGYQGWFNCESDGANLGWKHWARNRNQPLGPGNVTVDLWPDMSEYGADERFETKFRHADGRAAEVFSSARRETVMRHFRWMRDYGMDGAFLQRFAVSIGNPRLLRHNDQVLSHVRAGAKKSGRVYAVMYDLSGLRAGAVKSVQSDWRRLQREQRITEDRAYLHHSGRPLVAVWGIGFSDDRKYSVDECLQLVRWLKNEGCAVMLGVPTFWRDGIRDSVSDPKVHQTIREADVVSPWTVGRYGTPEKAKQHAANVWTQDLQWCQDHQLDFLPVVFPGFSWHNLTGQQIAAIPRLKGQFLWSQIVAAKRTGCRMIYVAMFDEVDEGTAIFKCTSDPPVGDNVRFLTYEGVPSDHYLKITGLGAKLLRGEMPITDALPLPIARPSDR